MSESQSFHDDPRAFELTGELRREAVRGKLFGAATAPRYLGRFVVHKPLGAGGVGSVFAAFDEELKREVAIKVLHDRRASGQVSEDRRGAVLAEARALARVDDARVVGVYEVGEVEGDLFMVMEYVRGETMGAWLAADARDLVECFRVFIGLADGLVAAHVRGVIHRDVKPANVMVAAEGAVRLVDFGLASTRSEDLESTRRQGTPAYMAPEQWTEGAATASSDQFSFCLLMYEALHGRRPFGEAGKGLEVGASLPCPNAEVPSTVNALIERGLAADPQDRWPSMATLRAELGAELARYESRGSWRLRLWIMAGVVLFAALGSFALVEVGTGGWRNEDLAWLYVGVTVVIASSGWWLRDRLHPVNRGLVASVAAVFAWVALSRFTAARYRLAVDIMFAFEAVALSAHAAALAVLVYRWFWLVAGMGLGVFGATLLWPRLGFVWAIVWSALSVAVMVAALWRRGFRAPQTMAPAPAGEPSR